ncbi:MAG: cation:proton antiporter [Candidatus Thermoplasmatota archaeon]
MSIPPLLAAGIAFALAFIIGKITHRVKITSIVGFIITGIILGPSVLKIVELTPTITQELELLTKLALGFVAFIIGGELTLDLLKKTGKKIIGITIGESVITFFVVLAGIYILSTLFCNNTALLNCTLPVAIIFAAMAPASAPAGTVAVIHEYKAKGKLTDTILAIVGFDDGAAIIIYTFAIAFVGTLISKTVNPTDLIISAFWEITGAFLIGGAVGITFGYIFTKLINKEELLALTITSILLTSGLALFLNASLILSCMILGIVTINLFPQSNKPVFDHIKSISLPIYMVFFLIAGIKLKIDILLTLGTIGMILVITYVLSRITGKICGSYISALLSKSDPIIRKNLGLGILSQAGVAIGLSLLASHKLSQMGMPETGGLVVAIIATTTIIFEIIGPIFARIALIRSGETQVK